VSRQLLSFDLVVATVGRVDELARLLESVEARLPHARVLVVDQSDDESLLTRVVSGRKLDVVELRSATGLSRARNVALAHLTGDVVAFPDDDCTYPPGLLERLARRFRDDAHLGGITGRAEDESGRSSASWKRDPTVLTEDNLWNRAISFTIFLRRSLVQRVGAFDERLGLGSLEPWSSGESLTPRLCSDGGRVGDPSSSSVDVRMDDARVGLRRREPRLFVAASLSLNGGRMINAAGGTVVSLAPSRRLASRVPGGDVARLRARLSPGQLVEDRLVTLGQGSSEKRSTTRARAALGSGADRRNAVDCVS
jgi:glycosyltransferase involved in cell wall biosynthesis